MYKKFYEETFAVSSELDAWIQAQPLRAGIKPGSFFMSKVRFAPPPELWYQEAWFTTMHRRLDNKVLAYYHPCDYPSGSMDGMSGAGGRTVWRDQDGRGWDRDED